jgi:hypothetical protein
MVACFLTIFILAPFIVLFIHSIYYYCYSVCKRIQIILVAHYDALEYTMTIATFIIGGIKSSYTKQHIFVIQ